MREIWIYDIEVYPNLFCITLWDNLNTKKKIFEISDRINGDYVNQSDELYEFLNTNTTKYLVGYNSINYDDKVLRRFLHIYNAGTADEIANLNSELFECSKSIIAGNSEITISYKQPWNSLDLMLIHRFHKLSIGLKQVGVTLKCPKIQDLPYPFDRYLTDEEISEVIKYNENDVFITWKLYKASLEEINLRKDISQAYGVNVLNSSRSNIADKIVTKYIREKTGLSYDEIKGLRDDNLIISFKDIIVPIEFKSKELQKVYNTLLDYKVDVLKDKAEAKTKKQKDKAIASFEYDDCKYVVAKGGLHSNNPPTIYTEDADYELIDLDGASFYTTVMSNYGVCPPQFGDVFLEILRELTAERLLAKKNRDTIKANTLKITINSIYGKLGFEYGFLYSPSAMYKTTINGQLILLKLIENLALNNIKCFYANTDGATFKVKKSDIELFYKICDDYSKEIDVLLEFQKYKKCIIQNVNSYIIITSENKIKEKGQFLTDTFDKDWIIPSKNSTEILSKSFNAPIIAKAVKAYFIDDIPVRTYIENHKDLYDFCKSQKIGSRYEVRTVSSIGGEVIEAKQQKTNRFIVSISGSKLYKWDKEPNKKKKEGQVKKVNKKTSKASSTDRYSDLVSGFYITLFNDYQDKVDINYNYYVAEANKLIFPFENPQLSLF